MRTNMHTTVLSSWFQCEGDQFTCNDGTCIALEKRCNDIFECKDDSDENDCETLVIQESSYRKGLPPISLSGKTSIAVSVTVDSVTKIDELEMTFKARLQIYLQWRDERITFKNLAAYGNVLSMEKQKKIWIPNGIFSNTEGNTPITKGQSLVAMVLRQGLSMRHMSELNEETIYYGAENDLKVIVLHEPTFNCVFDLSNFPFDTQDCSMDIKVSSAFQNYTVMIPHKLIYSGKKCLFD